MEITVCTLTGQPSPALIRCRHTKHGRGRAAAPTLTHVQQPLNTNAIIIASVVSAVVIATVFACACVAMHRCSARGHGRPIRLTVAPGLILGTASSNGFLGMFFYRRHQQSYYMFNDVTAKTRFMDLVDGGSTYASDILHFENISYVLGRHHGHGGRWCVRRCAHPCGPPGGVAADDDDDDDDAEGKTLLHDVAGIARPGRVLAIIGASGTRRERHPA